VERISVGERSENRGQGVLGTDLIQPVGCTGRSLRRDLFHGSRWVAAAT
jgi:hypothetical protein